MSSTHITKWKLCKHIKRLGFKWQLIIRAIHVHCGRKEQCNQQKHLQKITNYVKVRVEAKTQKQKGMLIRSDIGTWHFDFHFGEQGDSQVIFERMFGWLASFANGKNVCTLHFVPKRMDVFDVHLALVDLLSGQDVRQDPFFLFRSFWLF